MPEKFQFIILPQRSQYGPRSDTSLPFPLTLKAQPCMVHVPVYSRLHTVRPDVLGLRKVTELPFTCGWQVWPSSPPIAQVSLSCRFYIFQAFTSRYQNSHHLEIVSACPYTDVPVRDCSHLMRSPDDDRAELAPGCRGDTLELGCFCSSSSSSWNPLPLASPPVPSRTKQEASRGKG